jgi:hypothetical protein
LLVFGLASALASGATVVRHWVRQAPVELVHDPAPVAALAPHPARRPLAAPIYVEPTPAPEPSAAPVASAETPLARAVPPRARPVPHEVAAPATRAATAEETAHLVLDAMGALRRDHDARRAQLLLDEYMRRSPEGPLAEEALALSIEAASALHDDRARLLATHYLVAYPGGRFRETAERVAARPPP